MLRIFSLAIHIRTLHATTNDEATEGQSPKATETESDQFKMAAKTSGKGKKRTSAIRWGSF